VLGPDLVTNAMHRRLASHGAEIARDCARLVASTGSSAATVLAEIETICARHQFFSTLILSRKIPLDVLTQLTASVAQSFDRTIRSAWQADTVLVATNVMMRSCRRDVAVETPRERNFLTLTDAHLDDVIRLMVLCGFQRLMAMNANVEARGGRSSSAELKALLDVYNRRLVDEAGVGLASANQPFILGMAMIADLPFAPVMQVSDGVGATQNIRLWNYCPLHTSAEEGLGHAEFLHFPFPGDEGLSFEDAWKAWLAINKIAAGRVPNWTPDQPFLIRSSSDDARVEIMFDLCETGLGGSTLTALRNEAHDLMTRKGWPELPTKDAHQRFVDQIVFDPATAEAFDVEFIELPYAIYKVGPNAILWDHLRSRGLFRAIARRAIRTAGGDTGGAKGRAFEAVVASALKQRLSPAAPIAKNVKIQAQGRLALEIDVAMVWHKCLVLIECKTLQKPVQYYKGRAGAVASRTADMKTILFERDQLLRTHAREIREHWRQDDLAGAIWVVCTVEAEYIDSVEPSLWLTPGSLPRMCTPKELCEFLAGPDFNAVSAHAAFVAFQ